MTLNTIDVERFCVAFGWAYGTALERKHIGEPSDGLTPQQLWDQSPEEDREFVRGVVREAFKLYAVGEAVSEKEG